MNEKWKGVSVDNLSQLDAVSPSSFHTSPFQNSSKVNSENGLEEI